MKKFYDLTFNERRELLDKFHKMQLDMALNRLFNKPDLIPIVLQEVLTAYFVNELPESIEDDITFVLRKYDLLEDKFTEFLLRNGVDY